MRLFQKVCAGGLLLVAFGGVVACGSDDDGGSSAKLESCKQVCDKSATANCFISIPADTCKSVCDAFAQASASCQDALKALSDCQLTSADVCTSAGCDSQEAAYQQACSK
jgi:hypothetical protein